MPPKIIIVVNADWYFWSHRVALARRLQSLGCEVVVAAAEERGRREDIEAMGFRFIPLSLQRRSTSIVRELGALREMYALYRAETPDLIHHVSIKPVLYGSIAARLAGVPAVINTIPGLGYMFLGTGLMACLRKLAASIAYLVALSGRRTQVVFQNPDDRNWFVRHRLVPASRAHVILGSGVDVDRFRATPEQPGEPVILLASRLIWDKGIGELVEASRRLRARGIVCRVVMVGAPDDENPNSVPAETLKQWHEEGVIEWWGLRQDMPEIYASATIVALPTCYPEGVPLTLLEAAASGRAIVTTDTPGCREVVRDGVTGLLVPARDPQALTDALAYLLQHVERRAAMGAAARELAVREFSEAKVIAQTIAVYEQLIAIPIDGRLPQISPRHQQ